MTGETKKLLLNVGEAVKLQSEIYGTVAYGRDALYALARTGTVRTVGTARRILFIRSSLESLLRGEK